MIKRTLKTLTLCVLCLSPFVACDSASAWQEISPKLYYKRIDLVLGGRSATLHALRTTPQNYAIKPYFENQSLSVKSMAGASEALAMINANFFEPGGKPLGLIIRDKKVINPLKSISWWSVFCVKGKSARIVHTSAYKAGTCDQAIQAGPRLVVNGKIPKLKEQIAMKSAIGLNKNGEVFFIVTEKTLPMSVFAEILQMKVADGGLELTHVLNLDGGSSTQLFVQTEKFDLDLPNFVRVPVGLGIYPKLKK